MPKKPVKSGDGVRSKKSSQFKCVTHVKERHNQPLFGVAFNPDIQTRGQYVFAVCGSNRVSVYEASDDGSLNIIYSFSDPETDEVFYSCCWSFEERSKDRVITEIDSFGQSRISSYDPLLIAAGARGIIRIINPMTMVNKNLKGHGLSINDLRIHPVDHNILMSVSKDHSIRLWNIKTSVCIAIFGGVEGHRDEVLSGDFHKLARKIITCGMDHSLKIWSLESDDVKKAIQESYKYDHIKSEKPFSTARIHFPNFTTRDIHRNYVDCVYWYGDFVLSKSCENSIVMWKAGKIDSELDTFLPKDKYVSDSTSTFIHEFELKESEIWFMRFSMDEEQRTIALGNMIGKTYVWDIDYDDFDDYTCEVLSHPKCTAPLRQTALSSDGHILICVADDATIWRWDRDVPQREDRTPSPPGSATNCNVS